MAPTGVRLDPVLGHNFLIMLLDANSALAQLPAALMQLPDPSDPLKLMRAALGGFSECSGLEMTLDIEEYHEGGRNGRTLKFPTCVKWSNITLKRGVGASGDLWQWHYDFSVGQGKRRDGVIMLMNDLHVPNNVWYFQRGLPVRYIGPSMNASQSVVAIESLEIAHEGIYQVPGVGQVAAAAAGLSEWVTR